MKSNHILKLAALSAAITMAGVAQINAATTNLVQNISFALIFYEQGPTNQPTVNLTTVKVNRFAVTTKSVIAAIGVATTNTFSARARLVLVQDATATNAESTVEIRDGTNQPVDVSGFISQSISNSVQSSVFNSLNGIGSGVKYSLLSLVVTNATLTASLNLSGFAITTHASIKNMNRIIGVDTVNANLAGTGIDTNGIPAVVRGVMFINGRTVTVE